MEKEFVRTKKEDRINVYLMFTISVFVLFSTNMLFNSWISAGNRVFYLDDLSMVSSFLRKNAGEFIFSTGGNKVRVISNALIWIVLKASEGNWEIVDEILLALNFVNAVMVFAFAYMIQRNAEIIRRCALSLFCGILFIASHFAYYNISELFGVMEGVAITLAIGILFLLYIYIESGEQKYFYSAIALYVLLIFTHERYFVLFVLFLVALFFQSDMNLKEKMMKAFFPLMALGGFWIIRIVIFGNRAIDGTGGTSVSDTFDILTAIKFCFSQVMYILGVNYGPAYLNGIEAEHVPVSIQVLIFLNIIFVLCMLLIYLRMMIKDQQFRNENLKKLMLFISFIVLCIICSSVTIRVEMRWIYVSYAAYLIFVIYMLHCILLYYPINAKKIMLTVLWVASIFITEQFYRMHYKNLYYWQEKDLSRELYNVTVEKYGTDLENRNIIIIGDVWKNRTESEWQKFFAPYLESNGINVIYAEDIYEADQYLEEYDNGIVLLEDQGNKQYIDITKRMNFKGVKYLYGIYEDCWCDMACAFEVRGSMYQGALLRLYYPDDLEVKGTPNGTIIINSETQINYELTGQLTTIEFDFPSQEINTIQINANYWVHENTGRSEDGRLSNTLYIDIY